MPARVAKDDVTADTHDSQLALVSIGGVHRFQPSAATPSRAEKHEPGARRTTFRRLTDESPELTGVEDPTQIDDPDAAASKGVSVTRQRELVICVAATVLIVAAGCVGTPYTTVKVAARSGERLRKEIGRGRLPRVGDV